MKLKDILLFPEQVYQKLSDRRITLYLGILFIGIADLAIPFIERYKTLFAGQSPETVIYNISLTVLFVVALGLVDVLFFTLPLSDLFRAFKKEKDANKIEDMKIKLSKVYMLAHTLIVPINIIVYFIFLNAANDKGDIILELAAYISLLVWVWFSLIISRGINVIYNFRPFFRRLVLLSVFLWTLLTGSAIDYIIRNWIMMLFKYI
jgi:hypothetical protein